MAIPFSLARRSTGISKARLLGHIWLRAVSIVLLGALLQALPISIGELPSRFTLLVGLQIAVVAYAILGIAAILFPWKKSAAWNWLICAIGIGLVGLLFAIHIANARAIAGGLSQHFSFGGGALTPWRYRIPGVLQRIGICYGIAATIFLWSGWRTCLFAAVILCAGYSVLMLRLPLAPFTSYNGETLTHTTGSLTREDNLARRIDERVFKSHVWGSYPDPEGLISTLTAIATVLIGIAIGVWLRTRRMPAEKCAGLLTTGVLSLILGICLDHWLMPINKSIWTPSFVVFTAALAMLVLGCIYWFADVCGYRRWVLPWRIFGTNAIAAFVAAGIVTRLGLMIHFPDPRSHKNVALIHFCQERCALATHQASAWLTHAIPHFLPIDNSGMTSLSYALAYVLVILLLMSPLYCMKVFLKV